MQPPNKMCKFMQFSQLIMDMRLVLWLLALCTYLAVHFCLNEQNVFMFECVRLLTTHYDKFSCVFSLHIFIDYIIFALWYFFFC